MEDCLQGDMWSVVSKQIQKESFPSKVIGQHANGFEG